MCVPAPIFCSPLSKQAVDVFCGSTMPSVRTREMIQAELDYLDHLAKAGVRVARSLPSLAGQFVESVDTTHGTFHAVVFEGLVGKQFELEELTPEMFTAWGKALGELHRAAQSYTAVGRSTWRDLIEAAEEQPEVRQAAKQLHRELAQLPINNYQVKDNYGLTHFDFELDNLIWDGQRFGILDFDDCVWHWYAADIAFALGDLFDDDAAKVDLSNPSFCAFIEGYRTAKPIADDELARIPLFLRLDNSLVFCKLRRAADAGDQDDDPNWLKELRQKLDRKMQRCLATLTQ